MFDFLRSPPDGPRVLTGHANGLITLNIEEADDATREKIRHDLHEPYRTLLGHFRHEVGHYYWDRLVRDCALEPFRALFGDERADYAEALQRTTTTAHLRTGRILHQLVCDDASVGGLGGDLGPLSARGRQPGYRARLRARADDLESDIKPFGRRPARARRSAGGAFLSLLNSWSS